MNIMAGKTKSMGQIKQVLQLYLQGSGIKAIARSLQMSKNTVRTYLNKINVSRWKINELLTIEDPVLESMFHAGNPAYCQDRFDYLKNKLEYYTDELKKPHVTKDLLWQEYKQEQPNGYGHSQFSFHLLQHIRSKNPTMVLEHKPGEKLFIDFAGKTVSYTDRETGEIIDCQLFVACLPHSGYSFIYAVKSQCIEDFLFALSKCLSFLGGVPSVLVPDNLKSAIIKASRYEPEVNRALEDFANHYGTVVIPTRVRKPRDKALVENRVHLTYTHVYAKLRNEHFFHSLI
jgi:transposase